jgi:hypothetical protein
VTEPQPAAATLLPAGACPYPVIQILLAQRRIATMNGNVAAVAAIDDQLAYYGYSVRV